MQSRTLSLKNMPFVLLTNGFWSMHGLSIFFGAYDGDELDDDPDPNTSRAVLSCQHKI